MDDSGNRENGRHKPDQYRSVQWMMPQHQVKDHNAAQTVKFMSIIAERDNAIYERDLALSEKKTAQAERDMAIFQRDAAINERNNAIIERDNAIEALEYVRDNNTTTSNINGHSNSPYDHRSEVFQTSSTPGPVKSVQQGKKPRIKSESVPSKKGPNKSGKKNKRSDDGMSGEWRDDGVKSQSQKKHRKEWKVEDLGGLNEVVFDESTMPVPVCSCTGRYQPCYKWGNGGWQSACCTTTISMYPLPMMPNKRHARVNGRKMSGTVFSKLLSKMAAEGHDLSVALDLKDHWSKHGTNRYITIK